MFFNVILAFYFYLWLIQTLIPLRIFILHWVQRPLGQRLWSIALIVLCVSSLASFIAFLFILPVVSPVTRPLSIFHMHYLNKI